MENLSEPRWAHLPGLPSWLLSWPASSPLYFLPVWLWQLPEQPPWEEHPICRLPDVCTAVGVLCTHLMAAVTARPLRVQEQHGCQVCVCSESQAASCKAFLQVRFHCYLRRGSGLTASMGVPAQAAVAPLDGSVHIGAGRGTRHWHGAHLNHSCKHTSVRSWAWASSEHIYVHRGHFVIHSIKQRLGKII